MRAGTPIDTPIIRWDALSRSAEAAIVSASIRFETLESRMLLAGVTILTHGYRGNITGWISSAADAIIDERLGGDATSYILRVGTNSSGDLRVRSFKQESGRPIAQTASGEMVVKLDWTDVDDGEFSTGEVGRVVADYLMAKPALLPAPLASVPIHLIGHSRGASLVTAIAQRLGQHGVWVDQLTSLDPHPVDGHNDFLGIDFGDAPMRTWSNIAFADDYWRTDGNTQNFDFDGESVAGAHEGKLNNSVQKDFVSSAHIAVTAYYHGTIDTGARANNDHPIFSSWYDSSNSKPPRTRTGYYFSRIEGGVRASDGLSPSFGGTAARVDVGQSGSQWSNADAVQALDRQVQAGEFIRVRFRRQDRDSSARVNVFLDRDRNPFNTNTIRTIAARTYRASGSVVVERLNGVSDGVAPGNYYVYTRTTDAGGHVRYAYSNRFAIIAPQARALASHVFSTTPIATWHADKQAYATTTGSSPTTA
jgi:hypothetical protein